MTKIRMIEKRSAYQVTYLADRPGEAGVKSYTKKVFAGNERDAVIAFNSWFDSCKAFPEGSSCDIQKVELIQSEGANEAFDGWDGWEEIEGLESALDGIENLAYELRSCVRGAKTGCKDWAALSRHVQNLAAKLDDAAGEMAYKRDDGNESKRNEGKAYTFTWWDNEPAADRRPTTKVDLKKCLHKETFNAADDAEALKMAVEYLCDYIGDDPENVADTPEEIWDYFDSDWGDGNPIPMVLKQRSRVVKDSGFNPNREDDESKHTKK